MRKRFLCVAALWGGLLFFSLARTEALAQVKIDWKEKAVTVMGVSSLEPNAVLPMRARLAAKRAALEDAFFKLEAAVDKIRVTSDQTLLDLIGREVKMKGAFRSLIRAARIVDERKNEQTGWYEVTVSLKLYGENSVGRAIRGPWKRWLKRRLARGTGQEGALVSPEIESVAQEESGEEKPYVPPPLTSSYTGIIIDARGLTNQTGQRFEPSMSPKILDGTGRVVYGEFEKIDAEQVLSEGIVDFTESLEEAKSRERSGANPLLVSGVALSGASFPCDVVVSEASAKKMDQEGGGLRERMRVVIVF